MSTLETEGIAAATTGEAIGLTSLTSTIALIVLFGTGFAVTAGSAQAAARCRRQEKPATPQAGGPHSEH